MKQDMHYGAIKPIFKNAEYLRKNMTHEEKMVWAYLSNNQMGFKFRRQHPIWMYIADFYCHRIKLAIEIDGSIHKKEDVKISDAKRQSEIENLGISVLQIHK